MPGRAQKLAAATLGVMDPEASRPQRPCADAGLTLSLTTVSLVPLEMLAAGFIPVVNDADHSRIVLANPLSATQPHIPKPWLRNSTAARPYLTPE